MPTPPDSPYHPDTAVFEQHLAGMLREVLTIEERRLLDAFAAILNPLVRRSLVDLAVAAAGTEDADPGTRDLEDAHTPPARDPVAGGDSITLRRVRAHLLRPAARSRKAARHEQ